MTSARTETLPGDIDAEHATARLKDGLLEVTLPKTAKAKLQRIADSALYQRMASTDGINGWPRNWPLIPVRRLTARAP
ncbi:MAG: Hsp20/alpha crystallin family protein, partial [Gammaproteobacteria bacterium]